MQKLIKCIVYSFVGVFLATSAVTLVGLLFTWFGEPDRELPYLGALIAGVIIEAITIILIYARKGIKYLPDVRIDKSRADTINFMRDFISTGSSATIVTNRMSWAKEDAATIEKIAEKIRAGVRVEIITPKALDEELKNQLEGAHFFVTGKPNAPEARFTLINADRAGAEKLAIARGVHPDHEITVFDNNSGPQIIAMAKDIISHSKGRENA